MKTPLLPLAWSLRDSWRKGFSFSDLLCDIKSGLTVGIVAIPLSMALGISSGTSPQNGLYTVIIAGTLTSLLGGSRFQITGPTAAFVVLLLPIVQQFGLIGLCTAGFLSGLLLILFGLLKLGNFIKLIPHPVVTGFTTGIALVIALIQFQDFFGLTFTHIPGDFIDRLLQIIMSFPHLNLLEMGMGFYTLLILIIFLKNFKKIPAPLAAVLISSVVGLILYKINPNLRVETIDSRFHGIPSSLPSFSLSNVNFDYFYIKKLLNSSFAIALLAAIESLLSAVIADGMTQTRHNPNAELLALGISNIICPFFGGIPATGALARTATNIRFGAKSALSGVIHGVMTLVVLLTLSPMMGHIPMAALAAILLVVAYNMSELHQFSNILKYAESDDRLVLLTCFILTVVFDMTIGIAIGLVLASLLFMRRVSRLAKIELLNPAVERPHHDFVHEYPSDLFFYDISGPLFFGAAEEAIDLMLYTDEEVRTVILNSENVSLIDATGMVSLYGAISELLKAEKQVILITTNKTMVKLLEKGAPHVSSHQNFKRVDNVEAALAIYKNS